MKKSSRKTIIVISLILLIFSSISYFIIFNYTTPTSIVCLVSSILGVIGSIISIFIPNKYKYDFTIDDWAFSSDKSYTISISSKKHGLGKDSHVSVFLKNKDGKYEEVGTAIHINNKGDIIIGANIKFGGRIVVK